MQISENFLQLNARFTSDCRCIYASDFERSRIVSSGANSERNCLQNVDDPIPRVTVDVSVPQDLKEVAEAVRLAESAPMPKTLKDKR